MNQYELRNTAPTLDPKKVRQEVMDYWKNLITASLCVINEKCMSTLLLFVKIIKIESKQLVHIKLHGSHDIT